MSDRSRQPYRCALIGCGRVSASHFGFYPNWKRATLAACADPEPAARQRVREAVPGCREYADHQSMLDAEETDLAIITTRPNLHHAITLAAAARTRAILCEKPIALNLSDAEEMVRVCRERGVQLAIGHQRRYDPQYAEARRRIVEGAIGEPLHADVHWPCSAKGYLGGQTLAVDGGGFVMYLGVHVFDLLHFCFGPIRSVNALLTKKDPESDIEDGAICRMEARSGVSVSVYLGESICDLAGAGPSVSSLRFIVTGAEGRIAFGDFSLSYWIQHPESPDWEEVPCDPIQNEMGFQRLHGAILDSLTSGQPTLCDGAEALHAHRIAMACYESSLTGRSADPDHLTCDAALLERVRRDPGQPWRIGGL